MWLTFLACIHNPLGSGLTPSKRSRIVVFEISANKVDRFLFIVVNTKTVLTCNLKHLLFLLSVLQVECTT